MEVGNLGGGTTVVTRELRTYLYFVLRVHDKWTHLRSSSWRGCSRGAAAEADTIREQQAEASAIGEQQLKRTQLGISKLKQVQSGNSSWSGCSWGEAAGADTIWVQFGLTTRD